MKILIGGMGLLMLAMMAGATTVYVQPLVSYNSTSNVLTISFPSQTNLQLQNGGNINLIFNSISLTNINESGTSLIAGQQTGFAIAGPAPVSLNLSLSATNSLITNTISPEANVTFKYNVQPIQKCSINQTIAPSWNSIENVSNSIYPCSISITVNAIAKLGIKQNITAPSGYVNSLYGINITNRLPQLNINQTLGYGGTWIYQAQNVIIRASNLTVNDSLAERVFSKYSPVGCAQGANVILYDNTTNTPITICKMLRNQTADNIIPQVISYALSSNQPVLTGLGQGMEGIYIADNQSAQSWHGQYASCYNHFADPNNVSSTQYQLGVCQTNETNAKSSGYLTLAIVLAVIIGFVGINVYFNIRQKREREGKRVR